MRSPRRPHPPALGYLVPGIVVYRDYTPYPYSLRHPSNLAREPIVDCNSGAFAGNPASMIAPQQSGQRCGYLASTPMLAIKPASTTISTADAVTAAAEYV